MEKIRLSTFSIVFRASFLCILILNMVSTGTMTLYSILQEAERERTFSVSEL